MPEFTEELRNQVEVRGVKDVYQAIELMVIPRTPVADATATNAGTGKEQNHLSQMQNRLVCRLLSIPKANLLSFLIFPYKVWIILGMKHWTIAVVVSS